eukprot:COSAG04_NODE_28423_length_275_cov_7.414773_1_plen_46_part_10
MIEYEYDMRLLSMSSRMIAGRIRRKAGRGMAGVARMGGGGQRQTSY